MSQYVSIGETAEFRCQHTTADSIRWKVNGRLVGQNNRPTGITLDINDESGSVVNILRIMGLPQYNGTEVVGKAIFFDNSPAEDTSPAAVLQGT